MLSCARLPRRALRSGLRLWVLLPALSLLGLTACEPNNQGYAPPQPIAYSHAVHAGAMEVPCQYCHYSADKGRYAGIPPAQICMNCHKQVKPDHPEVMKVSEALEAGRPIEWNRVHWLPDHVFFDHSVHVNGGVACQDCHGPVENMGVVEQWAPLTMGWCIDCHRSRGGPTQDLDTAHPAAADTRLTDCSTCHH